MSLKILMVTMGLNIGGAETHIIELSKELRKRGYEVIIASNGGVYVDEIKSYGIKHFDVPLHRRNARCMRISYNRLKKIIRDEKPDIVHAHARIPAFITGLVRRKIPFNFMTTAHGVYDTRGALRYLSNWGDKVIAVSEDIRRYLIDSYNVPDSDISLTINGIDMDKFSPQVSDSKFRAELGLSEEIPVICHVSRLDQDSSVVGEQLITAMEAVRAKIENAHLVIAGGGTEFARLSEKAESFNKRYGKNVIIMTGPRTDINEVVASCSAFVGVSRTSLEAMAMEKPVILAGNAGYMGIFSREKTAEAKATNFCCRQSVASRPELLADDIVRCLQQEVADMPDICSFERKMVIDGYSVRHMADDYERVYRIVRKPRFKLLMSGYYGFNNAGDEAILNSIYQNLSALEENLSISVLIANPDNARKIYDYCMVNRFKLLAVLRAIKNCDILISGGGSLLQDRTSTKSIVYYLAIINIAKFFRKKVVLYSNGIGPVIKPKNRRRVKNTVNKVDLITLRDANSEEELHKMGVTRSDIHITADPVFTYKSAGREEALGLLNKAGIPTDKPFVGVSVRSWYDIPDFAEKIAYLCDEIYDKYGYNIVFVVMQTPNDIAISEEVQQHMKSPSFLLSERYQTSELMGIVGCADFVLCMRLHTLIFAAHMGVPTLGMVYDPKVKYYLELLGMPSLGNVDSFNNEEALNQINNLVSNRTEYVSILQEKTLKLQNRALQNEELFKTLLVK